MNTKRIRAALALFFAFALIATACSDDDGGDGGTDGATTTVAEDGAAGDDGDQPGVSANVGDDSAVFVASQWPECTNPITSCASASWLSWISSSHVLPRLMELDVNGEYVASPVLTEAPTVDNGGVVEHEDGSFSVTYTISPDAVWSDGSPITSADIAFTLDAKLDTAGTLSTAGYDLITDIDASDPKVVVITFAEPYAPWRDLFGGATDHFLKADEFDGTDVSEEMNDGVMFSGGPWKTESFSQDQMVLVPNENYWDAERVPELSEVVFVPREETESQITALRSGEASVAYPEPFPGIDESVGDLSLTIGPSPYIEGLWINQQSPNSGNVLASKAVREAVLYALDREVIAETALSYVDDPTVLNCAGWNPRFGEWCDESDFGDVEQDLDRVATLLEGDGWTREEGDRCWSKDGQELDITINTTAGNTGREDVQAVIQEMTRPAGICWTIQNHDPGEFFENRLPVLNYGPAGLFSGLTSPDPAITYLYDSGQIPTEENGFSGQNILAYSNPDVDELLARADAEVDEQERLELVHQIGDIIAEDVAWIPLYLLPNSTIWNPELIAGPVDEYNSHVYSSFANMYDWTTVG